MLSDLHVRGKYRDVILPMAALLRLDTLLEDTKKELMETKRLFDYAGVVDQDSASVAHLSQLSLYLLKEGTPRSRCPNSVDFPFHCFLCRL